MNPYFKVVRSLIRFIAAGLILIGSLLAGLELVSHRAKGVELNLVKVAVYAFLLLAGVVIFAVAGKIAACFTDEDDEADDSDDPQIPSE